MNKKLKTLLKEYGDSLARVDGEKKHQSDIAKRAEVECRCSPRHFKKLAMAEHKAEVTAGRDDLQEQIDLFDSVIEGGGE